MIIYRCPDFVHGCIGLQELNLGSWEILLQMDLVLTTSFLCKPSKDEPILENTDFKPSHGPILQKAEISVFQNPQHSLFQNGSKSCARQELQRLYNSFRLWLQPEKHSKDEIIFQVVLEQFMVNRHYSDRSTLKEKWESSGRKLERFIEDLSDDWVKPPRLVSRGFCILGWGAGRTQG